MAQETILQHWIFSQFILPFVLIFAIVFAVLEKTKILGENQKQVNAIIAFVIGLIFVGAVFPKQVVENLVLFLAVGLVILLVFLMLYGFVVTKVKGDEGFQVETWMKWTFGIIVGIAVIIAIFWATGSSTEIFNVLFQQDWSNTFWTNVLFIAIIAIVLAVVLKGRD